MSAKSSFKETLKLYGTACQVFWKRILEGTNIILFYYSRSWTFFRLDTKLLFSYWKESPFSISHRYWEAQGATEPDIYGETPLTTIDLIATLCSIGPDDCVYELGCGRGRTCFWLRLFRGCRVVGIECIPTFTERAQQLQQQFKLDKLTFKTGDFLQETFTDATYIYLYGTTLDEPAIQSLIQQLKQVPSGTRIITVSYPLNDYCDSPLFKMEKQVTLPFLWGEAEVYIQRKISS